MAPNAIATVVSTRCLSPNAAIALAAVFNFVGLVGMTYISTAVAKTMFGMVDFSGDTNSALYALVGGYDRRHFVGHRVLVFRHSVLEIAFVDRRHYRWRPLP